MGVRAAVLTILFGAGKASWCQSDAEPQDAGMSFVTLPVLNPSPRITPSSFTCASGNL